MKPLWNTSIFFLNRRCPVGCDSCNVLAAMNRLMELTPEWLEHFFSKQTPLPTRPFAVWTGGEPFLSFPSLLVGIKHGHALGFHSEILTSGIWFNPSETCLEQLKQMGPFSLRISLDAEHQAYVPHSLVEKLVHKATSLDISVAFTVRHIPGKPDSVNNAINFIKRAFPDLCKKYQHVSRWIHVIPSIYRVPLNHKENIVASELFGETCKFGFRDLVIGNDGRVYPCCGIFMIEDYGWLSMGDALQDTWQSIWGKMNRFPLFKLLRNRGLHTVIDCIGLPKPDRPVQEPLCSLCISVLSREECRRFFLPKYPEASVHHAF